MTPNVYRRGGRDLDITYAIIDSPFGFLMLGATECGLCFVQFGTDDAALLKALREEYPEAQLKPMADPEGAEFAAWRKALVHYLQGNQPRLDLPVDVRATAFQMRVWGYLQSIPYGEVRSYREVAEAIGRPTASRAVAQACAVNRVALAIPCHRVIRSSGDLGGYRWGIERKRKLLHMESSNS